MSPGGIVSTGTTVTEPGRPRTRPQPLVQGGEVAVEIPRIRMPRRHLAARGRYLTKRFAVAGHVSRYDEDMAAQYEREVLGDRQGQAWGQDPLHDRIVGRVEQKNEFAGGGPFLERVAHRGGVRVRQTHGGDYDTEGFAPSGRLCGDLGGELEVRQARDREDGQFLAAHKGGKTVDRGHAGQHGIRGRLAHCGFSGCPATGERCAANTADRRPAAQHAVDVARRGFLASANEWSDGRSFDSGRGQARLDELLAPRRRMSVCCGRGASPALPRAERASIPPSSAGGRNAWSLGATWPVRPPRWRGSCR
jgi:hypothetical protein